jgi:predicted ester cyclase
MRQANSPSLLMAIQAIRKGCFFSTLPVIIVLMASGNGVEKQPAGKTDTKISQTTNTINSSTANRMQRDELVKRLIRAGELEVSGDNPALLHSLFDTVNFKIHAPGGSERNYAELDQYFKFFRAAFDNRSIKRGIMVVEGNYIACQTTIKGDFVREFANSPIGIIKPNGKHFVYQLMNIFRFDEQGRLAEEWVQTDYRSYLRQLGAEGK